MSQLELEELQTELQNFRDEVLSLKDGWVKRETKLLWEAKTAMDVNYWVLQGQIKELGRIMLEVDELLK